MHERTSVQITRIRPGFEDIPLPHYATGGAAGMDIRAALEDAIILQPGERDMIPTGIAVALPEGFECQVRPRSGLALKHGISMVNNPGTIDEDYRGEIRVLLINHGDEPFTIQPGERIAQIVIARYEKIVWDVVEDLPESTRGTGGFGSTGTA